MGEIDGREVENSLQAITKAIAAIPMAGNPPPLYKARVFRKGRFAPRVQAASCATVDFREKLGEPRNQDGLNWCFGSVAADALSAEIGLRVSDFDLSLRTFASFGKPLGKNESITKLATASINKAVTVARRDGICTEESLPSNDRVLGYLAAEMERNRNPLSPVEMEEWAATTLGKAIRSLEDVRGWSLNRLGAAEATTCDVYKYANSMFPKLDETQVFEGISSAQSNEALFQWLVSLSCRRQPVVLPKGTRLKQLLPPDNALPGAKGFHLLTSMDKRLDKQKPVIVGLNANRFVRDEGSAQHAAIIVGREFRDGKCKYLVRNSAGPGCGQYKDPYGNRYNCSRGHFWITEEDFHQTADFLEFFE